MPTKSPISRKSSDLEDKIQETYEIRCEQKGCNTFDQTNYDAAFDFFKMGWRLIDGEWAACPKCVKKIREKLKAQGSVATKVQSKNKTSVTKKK